MTPIASLVALTLETRRLEAVTDFYTAAFGLVEVEADRNRAALRGTAGGHPQLVLHRGERRGLRGLGFALRSREDVDRGAAELAAAGVRLSALPAEREDGYGFAVCDPDETELTFSLTPPVAAAESTGRPQFLSHVVLNSLDSPRLVRFYVEILGFTVSDAYEKGLLTFLRCDQPQHHCIGISPGESAGLNHFAMDCGDIDGLMRGVGRMSSRGHEPIWGPGRHGPGGNVFCYYQDPDGFVPEFTCDVLQIRGPEWQPTEWARTPANGNVWGTGAPTPRAVELMSGAVETGAYA